MKRVIFAGACVAASAVAAHQGVLNPVVKARMANMSAIAENVKTLGVMAKGGTAFDQFDAREAARRIAAHAAETPSLFEAPESAPQSEARPEIWENFEDFSNKAGALVEIAELLSTSITEQSDLAEAMRTLGASCKSCHADYRN
jgi:cytochrome c556